MKPYFEFPGFDQLYLEDSFILDVIARPGSVVFVAEIVLREEHPGYRPPRSSEKYCYRRGRITFGGVGRLTWLRGDVVPARDATGETDFGGFDEFGLDGRTYILSGDFGTLQMEAATCTAELDN